MASKEVNPKSERKKMIAAMALGVAALFTLWYAFFGSTPKPTTPPKTAQAPGNTGTLPPNSPITGDGTDSLTSPTEPDKEASLVPPTPIVVNDPPPPGVPEVSRNIFAYYVPPPPTPKPTAAPPTPTPTPPPPIQVSSVSPSNVYARTGDFKMDVTGDKFTPQTRVYMDGRELETRYISPQQLSANVPAAVIAYEGMRQIVVRTPDGSIYSNNVTLTVGAPPAPNYTYVGLVGGKQYNDTAILKDKSSKNLVNVQRGDTVGGRFRVTSISQREVVLVDTNLRIKHSLPLTTDNGTPGGQPRVPQNVGDEGEEPE